MTKGIKKMTVMDVPVQKGHKIVSYSSHLCLCLPSLLGTLGWNSRFQLLIWTKSLFFLLAWKCYIFFHLYVQRGFP